MNTALYIHQGLGDAVVCNSLVRDFCKKNTKVTLFCRKQYYESIGYMFRDITNIVVHPINEEDIVPYIRQNNFENVICVGFSNLTPYTEFDKQMYEQVNIPHETRWNNFFIKRNIQAEDVVYNNFVKENEPYIFLHEDVSREFIINRAFIQNKNLKVVEPTWFTDNMYLYAKLIENAEEVHCIDSSFLNFTEHLQPKGKLFYHKYARPLAATANSPTVRKDWDVISSNNNIKNNIALLTYHTVDDHVIAYCDITKENKIEYCKKHGYDFYNFNQMNRDEPTAPEWAKFVYCKKLLGNYNWLFWTDADSLITNQQIKAENFIDNKYDIVTSFDACGLNTGTFFIKNSEFSKTLLSYLLNIRKDYEKGVEYAKKIPSLGEHNLSDQDALAFLINTNWNNCRERVKILNKKLINSYFFNNNPLVNDWTSGDFIMHLPGTHKRKFHFSKVLPYIKK